jgi:hypothetical protein
MKPSLAVYAQDVKVDGRAKKSSWREEILILYGHGQLTAPNGAETIMRIALFDTN